MGTTNRDGLLTDGAMENNATKQDIINIMQALANMESRLEGRMREVENGVRSDLKAHAELDRSDFDTITEKVDGLEVTRSRAEGGLYMLKLMFLILAAMNAYTVYMAYHAPAPMNREITEYSKGRE